MIRNVSKAVRRLVQLINHVKLFLFVYQEGGFKENSTCTRHVS